jgi:hypothetical protein
MCDALKVPEVPEPVPGTAHRETGSRFQVPYRGNRTGEPVSGTENQGAQASNVGTFSAGVWYGHYAGTSPRPAGLPGAGHHAALPGTAGTTQAEATPSGPVSVIMTTTGPVRRPLPPPLPAPPPDEALVSAIATETAIPSALVRRWLGGGHVPAPLLPALRAALWKPLGGPQ